MLEFWLKCSSLMLTLAERKAPKAQNGDQRAQISKRPHQDDHERAHLLPTFNQSNEVSDSDVFWFPLKVCVYDLSSVRVIIMCCVMMHCVSWVLSVLLEQWRTAFIMKRRIYTDYSKSVNNNNQYTITAWAVVLMFVFCLFLQIIIHRFSLPVLHNGV